MAINPFLTNRSPASGETGVDGYINISVDILDDTGISNVDAYVNGTLVFDGSGFTSPWNGSSSSFTAISSDGYDGYRLILDNTGLLSSNTIFTVRIVAQDTTSNITDESYTFRTGNKVSSIEVNPFEITINVEFEEDVASGHLSPGNYRFTNRMYARLAEQINSKKVRLYTELFNSNDSFTLTVNNIVDSYGGDVIPSSYSSKTFSPFNSSATLSNYNGKIRTWRDSRIALADTQRLYIASIRGIDVFRRQGTAATNPSRLGQIFDSYSISAMFVANFGGALVIADTTAPTLTNLSPSDLSTASSSTSIGFTISDEDSAVEITSVTVYVEDDAVFTGGFGGWATNWTGTITVGYQTLAFSIIPPSSFTAGDTINVRVVASDLFGNRLDTTYSFFIETPAVSAGWGLGPWGTSSWGGV